MGLLRMLEVAPSVDLETLLMRLDSMLGGVDAEIQHVSASAPERSSSESVESQAAQHTVALQDAVQESSAQVPVASTENNPGVFSARTPSDAAASPAKNPAWAQLVEDIRQIRPALASVLEHGHVLECSPTALRVGFVAQTFYLDSAKDPENIQIIQKQLGKCFSKDLVFSVHPLDPSEVEHQDSCATESLAEASAREKTERLDQIKRKAATDPRVQSATRILGGEIKEVTPLSGSEA